MTETCGCWRAREFSGALLLASLVQARKCWTTVMDSFWRFLRDERNQQVLGWLGGGLVVAATGLWAAFIYFYPSVESSETKASEPAPAKVSEPTPKVQADCSGIAIGGNVSSATITTGATTNSGCASKAK